MEKKKGVGKNLQSLKSGKNRDFAYKERMPRKTLPHKKQREDEEEKSPFSNQNKKLWEVNHRLHDLMNERESLFPKSCVRLN